MARLVIVAAPLYFAWEMFQMPGYVMPERWVTRTAACLAATVGDVAIVLGLWWLATVAFRDARWFVPPRPARYALVVVAAVAVNVVIEWAAVRWLGWWSYSSRQPTVPGTGTGVFAVLQALVVPAVTFYWLARWHEKDRSRLAHRGFGDATPR